MKLIDTLKHKTFEREIPFNRFLGIRVLSVERGKARLLLPYREEFVGDSARPALHGGLISTLVDIAAAAAVFSELGDSDTISTIDLVVDYLLPARLDSLEAEAHLIRIGNRVAVAQVKITQPGRDEIVAQGRAAINIVRNRRATT